MRLLFAGTSEIAIPSLKVLMERHQLVGLLTQPDRPVGRHQIITPPITKQFLQHHSSSTPIFQPEHLSDPIFLEQLRSLHPQVLVTMSYGKIVPRELLSLPLIACLNIHTSLLPRYRGATPIQAAILAGDEETGITIIYMAEGLDTGDILLQKKIHIAPRETTGSLTQRLSELANETILEALKLLEEEPHRRLPQPTEGIILTRRITRTTAVIDPTKSAIELDRLIRAMDPKPGAHGTFLLPSGKVIALKIFTASVVAQTRSDPPGSLSLSNNRELLLACGQDALLLNEVQPEGRARMSASAFADGYISRE